MLEATPHDVLTVCRNPLVEGRPSATGELVNLFESWTQANSRCVVYGTNLEAGISGVYGMLRFNIGFSSLMGTVVLLRNTLPRYNSAYTQSVAFFTEHPDCFVPHSVTTLKTGGTGSDLTAAFFVAVGDVSIYAKYHKSRFIVDGHDRARMLMVALSEPSIRAIRPAYDTLQERVCSDLTALLAV